MLYLFLCIYKKFRMLLTDYRQLGRVGAEVLMPQARLLELTTPSQTVPKTAMFLKQIIILKNMYIIYVFAFNNCSIFNSR